MSIDFRAEVFRTSIFDGSEPLEERTFITKIAEFDLGSFRILRNPENLKPDSYPELGESGEADLTLTEAREWLATSAHRETAPQQHKAALAYLSHFSNYGSDMKFHVHVTWA